MGPCIQDQPLGLNPCYVNYKYIGLIQSQVGLTMSSSTPRSTNTSKRRWSATIVYKQSQEEEDKKGSDI
uniref:Ovule protein n=1 Tax=Steinernema glaseri TaxID=37863 RepID=A0A1I7Y685_9BILA